MGQRHFVSIGEYSISIALHATAYCVLALGIFSQGLKLTSVLSTWKLFALSIAAVSIAEMTVG